MKHWLEKNCFADNDSLPGQQTQTLSKNGALQHFQK
jgi:hypothetical protein